MRTIIAGWSDDLIVVEGGVKAEFSAPGWRTGFNGVFLACSDGTVLKAIYDEDGIWRFPLIIKGELFDHIEKGSVEDDTFDVVYFKDSIKWVALLEGLSEFSCCEQLRTDVERKLNE